MDRQKTRESELRSAVEELAHLARTHPSSGGGQMAMQILASTAFRIQVPIDLAGIGYTFSHPGAKAILDAALTAIRYRHCCDWPTDLLPDDEIRDWIRKWKIKYVEVW